MGESLLIKLVALIFIFLVSKNIMIKRNIQYYEKKHIKIMRETAAECTLFLNKNEEFPIHKPGSVLLIGSGARNTIKGGLGSGDVESRYYITCEEGLENAGFKITTKDWLNEYPLLKETKVFEHINYIRDIFTKNNVSDSFNMVSFPEYEYELKLKESEEKAEIAIYVLARNSGEGMDRRLIKGDVFLTDTEIKDILYLNQKFQKFMLVLNVGGVVDLSPVKEVSNILLLSQLGVVTGDILADIILGKVNPSGKLTTTWASVNDYKFINNFTGNKTLYREGVYVGYRYFDSFGIEPLYPFGFGKSYTSFEITKKDLTNVKDEITLKVKIKNIGKYSGKEVVQVYISPSQLNMDQPYQSLVSFKKTPTLKPSEEMEMLLTIKFSEIARYDEGLTCYILDRGNYIIRVGNSSRNTIIFGYVEIQEDILIKQLKKINGRPGFIDLKSKVNITDNLNNVKKIILTKDYFDFKRMDYSYKPIIFDKISKLNDSDLAYLCLGNFIQNKDELDETERGLAGTTTKKIKGIKQYIRMADGPSGLRIAKVYDKGPKGYHRLSKNPLDFNKYKYLSEMERISLVKNEIKEIYSNYTKIRYQYATALPIPTAYAQSFNIDLAKQYGDIIGTEMEIYNIDLWLAPAMNIHRTILCGRNFEYYSEDPFVSGKIASAVIKGVQSHKNKGATIKHFAANNQEYNRLNSDSKISERALREIYLKGFQIAIEESQPVALMTSYNLINRNHPSENGELLIDTVRKEWNFNGLIMTDWITSGDIQFKTSMTPPQFANNIIKAGNNLMMPGSEKDYNLIIEKLNEKEDFFRDDLLVCASKVYETIQLLNK